jgi:hypothetical protein
VWILFSADYALEIHNEAGGDQHRINGRARIGAVIASALEGARDAVGIAGQNARAALDGARSNRRGVQGEPKIGLWKAGEQPIIDHLLSAAASLLCHSTFCA